MSTSGSTPLLTALDRLNETVTSLEQALTKAESRIKTGGKRKTNQIDMFDLVSACAPGAATSAPCFNTDDVAHRLGRVIAQIEDVLQQAA